MRLIKKAVFRDPFWWIKIVAGNYRNRTNPFKNWPYYSFQYKSNTHPYEPINFIYDNYVSYEVNNRLKKKRNDSMDDFHNGLPDLF